MDYIMKLFLDQEFNKTFLDYCILAVIVTSNIFLGGCCGYYFKYKLDERERIKKRNEKLRQKVLEENAKEEKEKEDK